MKKLSIGIGTLLLIAAVAYAIVNLIVKRDEREIRTYAESAIVAIASNWNEQALLLRASPELLAATNQPEIDDMFLKYRQLGRMTSLSKGVGHFDFVVTSSGKKETAVYIAKAHFEHGSVAIKLSLIKHNDGWRIMGFILLSDRPPNLGEFGTMQPFVPLPSVA